MKKTIYLKGLPLTIILSSMLVASSYSVELKDNKKPPVDEGHNFKSKEDKTKEVTFVNDEISKEIVNFSLEKEGKEIVIQFIITSKVPLTCKVMRNKTEILSLSKEPKNPKISTKLLFEIDKSKLQVDDEIIITNRRDIKIINIKVTK